MLLRVEHLGVRFGEQAALAEVSFAVERGQLLLVTGPSGCGKSTLARCLNGLIPHSSAATMEGRVLVDGLDTREHPVWKLAGRIGLVLQHPEAQLFNLTVEEEVAFGPRQLGFPADEVAARVEAALAGMGLAQVRRRAPPTLSGGEKQRLAIAATLAMRPKVLVLDEALAQLDVAATRDLVDTIARLAREEGVAVVALEHRIGELSRLASQVLVLAEGRVVAEGPPGAVLARQELVRRLGLRRPARERQAPWEELIAPEVPSCGGERQGEGPGQTAHRPACQGGEEPLTPVPSPRGRVVSSLRGATVRRLLRLRAEGQGDRSGRPETASQPDASSPALLELRNVWAGYGGHMVLQGLDLALRRGEMAALVGDNGAGKSTLARVMAGLLPIRRGELRFTGARRRPRPGLEVALLLESPDEQLFCDTVADEVRFGAENLGLRRPELPEQALAATGLDPLRDRPPHTLSLGQRQRTALAALLALGPQLLILDEPTLGQDWGHLSRTMGLIQRLNAGGMTVLVVTHDYKLVHQYTRRVLLLRGGRIAVDGAPRGEHMLRDGDA